MNRNRQTLWVVKKEKTKERGKACKIGKIRMIKMEELNTGRKQKEMDMRVVEK